MFFFDFVEKSFSVFLCLRAFITHFQASIGKVSLFFLCLFRALFCISLACVCKAQLRFCVRKFSSASK